VEREAEALADRIGERVPADRSEPAGHLDEAGGRDVGHDDRPEESEAELGAGLRRVRERADFHEPAEVRHHGEADAEGLLHAPGPRPPARRTDTNASDRAAHTVASLAAADGPAPSRPAAGRP
jgi:hypothetical protein